MNKQAFFDAVSAFPRESVEVPGFGPVTVRAMSGAEYDRFEASSTKRDGKLSRFEADRGLVARLAVIDPNSGEQVFTDADLDRLRGLPLSALSPVVKAAFRLSGVGEGAEKN